MDSTKREADNEDNERVTDKRQNENSSIPGENGVMKKIYRRVRFGKGFRGNT